MFTQSTNRLVSRPFLRNNLGRQVSSKINHSGFSRGLHDLLLTLPFYADLMSDVDLEGLGLEVLALPSNSRP